MSKLKLTIRGEEPKLEKFDNEIEVWVERGVDKIRLMGKGICNNNGDGPPAPDEQTLLAILAGGRITIHKHYLVGLDQIALPVNTELLEGAKWLIGVLERWNYQPNLSLKNLKAVVEKAENAGKECLIDQCLIDHR